MSPHLSLDLLGRLLRLSQLDLQDTDVLSGWRRVLVRTLRSSLGQGDVRVPELLGLGAALRSDCQVGVVTPVETIRPECSAAGVLIDSCWDHSRVSLLLQLLHFVAEQLVALGESLPLVGQSDELLLQLSHVT